jgi:hypothetical protein
LKPYGELDIDSERNKNKTLTSVEMAGSLCIGSHLLLVVQGYLLYSLKKSFPLPSLVSFIIIVPLP